ncbi:MAG TPA: hypothetical protein VIH66_03380 [Gammaproteobacteria bacterium]
MNKLSIKGVLFGVFANIAGSTIARLVILVIYGNRVITKDMTDQELTEAMGTVIQGNDFIAAVMVAELLCTAIGGYIAARVAKQAIYLNSGMVGLVGVSIFLGYLFSGETPLQFNIIGAILVIPAALLGGHLAKSTVT